jgi:hypothetical protein
MLMLSRSGAKAAAVGAIVLAAIVISPAIGGPSLKKLVKKEVSKQLANKQGPQGPAGQQGPAGADLAANSTLRSGETLTGIWSVAGPAGVSGMVDTFQFVPQLPTDLGAGAVHRLALASTSAACPGPGLATAGNLCVYELAIQGSPTFNFIGNPGSGTGADQRGAEITYNANASSASFAEGSWAVTAP